MARIRVGVLRGGPSSEYDVSLKTGGAVLKNLSEEKYEGKDILITKDEEWYLNGLPSSPAEAAGSVDVFFNGLHGEYGEDGTVQGLLESLAVPYTGSDSYTSALGMNKIRSKEQFRRAGLRTPRHVAVRFGDDLEAKAREVFQMSAPPWIVKPADRGSSIGLSLIKLLGDLPAALEQAFNFSSRLLVEEYLRGIEATCAVVDNFRGQTYYALPPIEIRKPPHKTLFDYEAKYTGISEEICPGRFTDEEMSQLKQLAVAAHQALDLRHYSRADFIISPTRGIYLLEVNTLPGLTTESLLPKALKAEGETYSNFLDHVIQLALRP